MGSRLQRLIGLQWNFLIRVDLLWLKWNINGFLNSLSQPRGLAKLPRLAGKFFYVGRGGWNSQKHDFPKFENRSWCCVSVLILDIPSNGLVLWELCVVFLCHALKEKKATEPMSSRIQVQFKINILQFISNQLIMQYLHTNKHKWVKVHTLS